MEYYRTEEGQIYSDLAYRLGEVLEQYHNQIKSESKYEVSLCLSILHTLLTQCKELKSFSAKNDTSNTLFEIPINKYNWGIDETNIVYNSFVHDNINIYEIVNHIRNAVSHPNRIYANLEFPATGYTTSKNIGNIESLIFCDSPDIKKGRINLYSEHQAKNIIKDYVSLGVELYRQQSNREYDYTFKKNGKTFCRCFKIEMTPDELLNFTYSLSTYLSQSIRFPNWDGKIVILKKLVA